MKPRDVIIFAAVILIAGFAAADAIRGRAGDDEAKPPTVAPQTTPARPPGPQPQPDAPEGWEIGRLQGSLVFTDAADCRVRVIGLAGGVERPLARFAGTCQLWAPPVGPRIAYGLSDTTGDGFTPFHLADLSRPNAELGGYRALFGVVLWSPDGRRVAWCGRRRTGYDLEVGGAVRRLPGCPVAYTPEGRIAYAIGKRLVVEGDTILRADGGITYAAFPGADAAVVVVDGRRIEAYDFDALRFAVDLPPPLEGRTPILSPDGCAALFRLAQPEGRIELLDLGCFPGASPQFFQGRDAAWSPDGEWVAVAEPDSIVFHDVTGGRQPIPWPARAAELAWRAR